MQKKQNQQLQEDVPQSPNLILYSDIDVASQKLLPRVVVSTTYFCIVVFVVTLSLFTWNISINNKLNNLLSVRDKFIAELSDYRETEKALNQIVSLTNKYKELKDQRNLVADDIQYIYTHVPTNFLIQSFSYADGTYRLTTITPTALDIASFISELLRDKTFSSVVINSVTYSTYEKNYVSVLEVNK